MSANDLTPEAFNMKWGPEALATLTSQDACLAFTLGITKDGKVRMTKTSVLEMRALVNYLEGTAKILRQQHKIIG
jgi:hypothetical protein